MKEVQRYARRALAAVQTPERRGEVRGLLTLATASRNLPPSVPDVQVHRPGEVIPNTLDMQLVVIGAGEYLRGSSPAEVDHVQRIDRGKRRIEGLHDVEHHQRCDAGAVRRQLEYIPAAIGGRDRLDPLGGVLGEIVGRHRAAAALHTRDDPASDA